MCTFKALGYLHQVVSIPCYDVGYCQWYIGFVFCVHA
jgi:hypothetical protein